MLIGERDRFAVELELDGNYGGAWLYGRFCYWIGSVQVGDYELGTSLRDVLSTIETVIRDDGMRAHEVFFAMNAEELFARLDAGLFGNVSQYDEVALAESWARFNVGLPVDVFDEWKIFLVEQPPKARLVFKRLSMPGEKVHDVLVTCREFSAAVRETYSLLCSWYDKEQ